MYHSQSPPPPGPPPPQTPRFSGRSGPISRLIPKMTEISPLAKDCSGRSAKLFIVPKCGLWREMGPFGTFKDHKVLDNNVTRNFVVVVVVVVVVVKESCSTSALWSASLLIGGWEHIRYKK